MHRSPEESDAMITRRQVLHLVGMYSALPLFGPALAQAFDPSLNDDGLHVQPWFSQSFLDLQDDLAEAKSTGKHLVIFWEQRGCPYCRELHRVNLADSEITTYIRENFVALQLNLYGSREVTDFDSTKMEERRLAARWRINFTPTLCFFSSTLASVEGKHGGESEAWRLQGYWKPFHFLGALVYVREDGYRSQPNFQRWLADYADKLRAQGKDVKLW
jgi:thioredoxin-related protein